MARTNIQVWIDQERAIYCGLRKPLLAQLAMIHKVTVREFASIFGISKSNAQEILAHRKDPSLLLAFKIARYFEVSVDELFGWNYGDTGDRRPLVIEKDGKPLRLKEEVKGHGALELVKEVANELRRRG